jgi:hypothetical protein
VAGEFEYRIQGLRQFQQELAKLGDSLPVSLREYNVRAATEIITDAKAKANAYAPQQGKAAKSLRASRSASSVAVLLGDNRRYAFAMGSEFGARQYKQFPPWRGNQWTGWEPGPGYYLHPAIRDVGAHVVDELWESIRALAYRAFPE